MNTDALRARLAGLSDRHATCAPANNDRADDGAGLVPAAVLVPIELGPSPGIVLTKRTSHLARHPGQVSFPGGRIDPSDRDAEAAALREAWEEIRLNPAIVDVQGRLPCHVTGTGYCITPVVGLLPPEPLLVPAPDEVEAVFKLPLNVLLDPSAPRREMREEAGRRRAFWVWPHQDYYIWGATAAILMHLAQILRTPANPSSGQGGD